MQPSSYIIINNSYKSDTQAQWGDGLHQALGTQSTQLQHQLNICIRIAEI